MSDNFLKFMNGPHFSYLLVASILWVFYLASSVPTPIYQLYQQQLGFSAVTLTLIFSVYAVGMLVSLLVVGSLSDFLGRKPVVAGAIVLELFSMVVFMAAQGVVDLLLARFIQGFATGMATAVLGAFLMDLNSEMAAVSNSVVPLLGVGGGVTLSSLFIDFSEASVIYIYMLIFFFLCAQLIVLHALREPVARRPGVLDSLKPSLGVPDSARSIFMAILPLNAAVWSLNGFFLSMVPSLVRLTSTSKLAIVGGGVVGLLSVCGAVAVLCLRHKKSVFALRIGVLCLTLGIMGILLGVYLERLAVFYMSTIFAGVGAGASFIGFARGLFPLVPSWERAGLISAYYVVSQVSLIFPTVIIGLMLSVIDFYIVVFCYGGVLLFLTLISSVLIFYRNMEDRLTLLG